MISLLVQYDSHNFLDIVSPFVIFDVFDVLIMFDMF